MGIIRFRHSSRSPAQAAVGMSFTRLRQKTKSDGQNSQDAKSRWFYALQN